MIKRIEDTQVNFNSELTYEYEALGFAASGLQILKNRIDRVDNNLFMTGKAIAELNSSNSANVEDIVYTTGAQTIGGVKTFSQTIDGSINGNAATVTNGVYTNTSNNFSTRPTVNSIGVVLEGEIPSLPDNLVYTDAEQTISGGKTFEADTFLYSGAIVLFDEETDVDVSGNFRSQCFSCTGGGPAQFSERPLVNGTGVLLIGEASASNNDGGFVENVVYTTGDQTISGEKTFTPIDSMELSGADAYYIDNHVYFNSGNTTHISGTHIFYSGFVIVDENGASWKINIVNGQLNVSSI